MTNPQTLKTTSAPVAGPVTTVTNVGVSLIRLGATAVSVPLTFVGALGVSLIRLGTTALSVPLAVVAPQSRDEVVRAGNDVADAATRLYRTIIDSAISGVDGVTRAINDATAEITRPVSR